MIAETKYTRSTTALEGESKLKGYCARFNEESAVQFDPKICRGPFVEVIAPGAFSRSLRERPDVRSLAHHDRAKVLGRTKAGTLRLAEDGEGLAFENDIPDTSVGRDAREDVRSGNIDGCSFHGFIKRSTLEYRQGRPALHTIYEVSLDEVTPVCTFPAYDTTSVAVRSLERSGPEPAEDPQGPPIVATPATALDLAAARLRLARA